MAADVIGTTSTNTAAVGTTEMASTAQVDAAAPSAPPSAPAWRAALPAEIASEKAWDDIKGDTWDQAGPVIAKRFLDTQKLVGNSVRIPKPDAPPEEHARYRAARGVPESPDKYGLTWPTLPEGMPWSPDVQSGFLEVAHKTGLAPAEVTPLVDWYAGLMIAQRDAAKNAEVNGRREAVAVLEKKWGPQTGPLFKRNLGLANGFMDKFLPGEHPLRGQLNLDNPWLVEAFALAGETTLEDVGIEAGESEATSQDAIQAKIDALENDPNHPANNAMHPRHEEGLKERLELYRRRPGGRAPALSTA